MCVFARVFWPESLCSRLPTGYVTGFTPNQPRRPAGEEVTSGSSGTRWRLPGGGGLCLLLLVISSVVLQASADGGAAAALDLISGLQT